MVVFNAVALPVSRLPRRGKRRGGLFGQDI